MKSPLCFVEILCVLLFILSSEESLAQNSTAVTNSTDNLHAASLMTTEPTTPTPPAATKTTPSHLTTSQPTPNTIIPHWLFPKKECRQEFMVCGGVVVACVFFLMTTLLLTFKLCKLSSRLRTLRRHNVELTSASEFCVETSTKDQINSEAEAKETTLLMDDQTNQEVDADADKEDKGKVDEGGKKGGDAPKSVEASANDDAESLLFPKPPEEILGSESTTASSPSNEGGKEEPKSEP